MLSLVERSCRNINLDRQQLEKLEYVLGEYKEAIESAIRDLLEKDGIDLSNIDINNTAIMRDLMTQRGLDVLVLGGVKSNPFDQVVVLLDVDRGFVDGLRITKMLDTQRIQKTPITNFELLALGINISKELEQLRKERR